ncbi:hypothetical protein M9194_12315 [Vibrio sp. S4M6]|uniref:hypothetical protein n=1 Tax=Vibrio sinus TaxID=2946865 RepID=UPI002029C50F|nr:hypothetical protein [Vibrio sinus]MCL9782213.1 hypothetical protein [Vibrio sinus]
MSCFLSCFGCSKETEEEDDYNTGISSTQQNVDSISLKSYAHIGAYGLSDSVGTHMSKICYPDVITCITITINDGSKLYGIHLNVNTYDYIYEQVFTELAKITKAIKNKDLYVLIVGNLKDGEITSILAKMRKKCKNLAAIVEEVTSCLGDKVTLDIVKEQVTGTIVVERDVDKKKLKYSKS